MPRPSLGTFDIAVVGGGPAGLVAASEAAKAGSSVVLLEEHWEFGVPNHCAGLISVSGLSKIGIPAKSSFTQNEVKGAEFHSPTGVSFRVESNRVQAVVVDRALFDRYLAEQAAKRGVDLRLGCKVTEVERTGSGNVMVKTRQGAPVNAKAVIDAEGVVNSVSRKARLKPPSPEWLFPAVQFELASSELDPHLVELFFGEKIAPSFFAWVIPLSPETARVGLACRGCDPLPLLQSFTRKHFVFHRVLARRAGTLTLGGPAPKTYADGLLVVGDAAGQVKSTTGGGVITGCLCAQIAGRVAAESVDAGDCSASSLSSYQRRWREILGREFSVMSIARRAASRLSDRTLDEVFSAVASSGVLKALQERGDMDFQSESLLRLTRDREVFKILKAVIWDLINGM